MLIAGDGDFAEVVPASLDILAECSMPQLQRLAPIVLGNADLQMAAVSVLLGRMAALSVKIVSHDDDGDNDELEAHGDLSVGRGGASDDPHFREIKSILRLFCAFSAPHPQMTRGLLELLTSCGQRSVCLEIIEVMARLCSGSTEEINEMIDVYREVLDWDREFLVPILASLSVMNLPKSLRLSVFELARESLRSVPESDYPAIVRTLLRTVNWESSKKTGSSTSECRRVISTIRRETSSLPASIVGVLLGVVVETLRMEHRAVSEFVAEIRINKTWVLLDILVMLVLLGTPKHKDAAWQTIYEGLCSGKLTWSLMSALFEPNMAVIVQPFSLSLVKMCQSLLFLLDAVPWSRNPEVIVSLWFTALVPNVFQCFESCRMGLLRMLLTACSHQRKTIPSLFLVPKFQDKSAHTDTMHVTSLSTPIGSCPSPPPLAAMQRRTIRTDGNEGQTASPVAVDSGYALLHAATNIPSSYERFTRGTANGAPVIMSPVQVGYHWRNKSFNHSYSSKIYGVMKLRKRNRYLLNIWSNYRTVLSRLHVSPIANIASSILDTLCSTMGEFLLPLISFFEENFQYFAGFHRIVLVRVASVCAKICILQARRHATSTGEVDSDALETSRFRSSLLLYVQKMLFAPSCMHKQSGVIVAQQLIENRAVHDYDTVSMIFKWVLRMYRAESTPSGKLSSSSSRASHRNGDCYTYDMIVSALVSLLMTCKRHSPRSVALLDAVEPDRMRLCHPADAFVSRIVHEACKSGMFTSHRTAGGLKISTSFLMTDQPLPGQAVEAAKPAMFNSRLSVVGSVWKALLCRTTHEDTFLQWLLLDVEEPLVAKEFVRDTVKFRLLLPSQRTQVSGQRGPQVKGFKDIIVTWFVPIPATSEVELLNQVLLLAEASLAVYANIACMLNALLASDTGVEMFSNTRVVTLVASRVVQAMLLRRCMELCADRVVATKKKQVLFEIDQVSTSVLERMYILNRIFLWHHCCRIDPLIIMRILPMVYGRRTHGDIPVDIVNQFLKTLRYDNAIEVMGQVDDLRLVRQWFGSWSPAGHVQLNRSKCTKRADRPSPHGWSRSNVSEELIGSAVPDHFAADIDADTGTDTDTDTADTTPGIRLCVRQSQLLFLRWLAFCFLHGKNGMHLVQPAPHPMELSNIASDRRSHSSYLFPTTSINREGDAREVIPWLSATTKRAREASNLISFDFEHENSVLVLSMLEQFISMQRAGMCILQLGDIVACIARPTSDRTPQQPKWYPDDLRVEPIDFADDAAILGILNVFHDIMKYSKDGAAALLALEICGSLTRDWPRWHPQIVHCALAGIGHLYPILSSAVLNQSVLGFHLNRHGNMLTLEHESCIPALSLLSDIQRRSDNVAAVRCFLVARSLLAKWLHRIHFSRGVLICDVEALTLIHCWNIALVRAPASFMFRHTSAMLRLVRELVCGSAGDTRHSHPRMRTLVHWVIPSLVYMLLYTIALQLCRVRIQVGDSSFSGMIWALSLFLLWTDTFAHVVWPREYRDKESRVSVENGMWTLYDFSVTQFADGKSSNAGSGSTNGRSLSTSKLKIKPKPKPKSKPKPKPANNDKGKRKGKRKVPDSVKGTDDSDWRGSEKESFSLPKRRIRTSMRQATGKHFFEFSSTAIMRKLLFFLRRVVLTIQEQVHKCIMVMTTPAPDTDAATSRQHGHRLRCDMVTVLQLTNNCLHALTHLVHSHHYCLGKGKSSLTSSMPGPLFAVIQKLRSSVGSLVLSHRMSHEAIVESSHSGMSLAMCEAAVRRHSEEASVELRPFVSPASGPKSDAIRRIMSYFARAATDAGATSSSTDDDKDESLEVSDSGNASDGDDGMHDSSDGEGSEFYAVFS